VTGEKMMELKIPEVGESVQEALLAQWLKREGERVAKDDILFVIETDKVTLEIPAPIDGILKIVVPEGVTVKVGAVVGRIEEGGQAVKETQEQIEESPRPKAPEPAAAKPSPPEVAAPAKAEETAEKTKEQAILKPLISPSVRAFAQKWEVDLSAVTPTGPGGRITEGDILLSLEKMGAKTPPTPPSAQRVQAASPPSLAAVAEETIRKPMSPIRQRIAARLLEARQNTAMLTTFNEIDMGRVQALRKSFGEDFQKKYGIRLGLMSFFVKAVIAALKEIPVVNAFIDGNDLVYHNYYHIGMAIGAERGLVVPVIKNCDRLGFAQIEQAISDFAQKVRENKLDIPDLEGGTFTITNGGIFGSLLSTPILNPPQSAILGLHKIEDRPVAVNAQVVIRPMMYVALSYDHRIIDGREAVTFLRRIKELIENPERIMMEI
jgi:2-oxoglutarate dehydrogenase E2 component (dihydrolipoamide succinyltransferase)